MGYSTQYHVAASNVKDEQEAQFMEFRLNKVSAYHFDCSTWDTGLEFETDDIKWYDWEENLKELSLEFPHVLFEVDGRGEETGDIWKARVRNGESEILKPELLFPDFKKIV